MGRLRSADGAGAVRDTAGNRDGRHRDARASVGAAGGAAGVDTAG